MEHAITVRAGHANEIDFARRCWNRMVDVFTGSGVRIGFRIRPPEPGNFLAPLSGLAGGNLPTLRSPLHPRLRWSGPKSFRLKATKSRSIRWLNSWPQMDSILRSQRPARKIVIDFVRQIVQAEGPVHRDIVRRRLNASWGNLRMGERIKERLDFAIERVIGKNVIRADWSRKFLDQYNRKHAVPVRNRSHLDDYMRRPEVLPPAEIQEAALKVVERCISISLADCAKEVSRMFGYTTLRTALRDYLERNIRQLVEEGRLLQSSDMLQLP